MQAQLTLVASVETMAGGDRPGEVQGEVVPAAVVRQLARRLGLVPDDASPGTALPSATSAGDVVAPDVPEIADEPGDDERWADSGTWLGAERPPGDVERAFWQRNAEWAQWIADAWAADQPQLPDPGLPVDTGPEVTAAAGTWAAADAAVETAGSRLESARRAVAAAGRAVADAEQGAARAEDAWARSPAGQVDRASDTVTALAAATARQRQVIADLLDRTGGGGLVDRPRIAVVDALSGTLLALTDAPALRRLAHCGRSACLRRRSPCTHDLTDRPGLGPPVGTDRYRPSAELDRFVRARDRRCRFPGCRHRVPRGGELDHDRPWPTGPTAAGNLTGYCTRHHRGKHQAPGWTHRLHPDGRLTVTTPTGLTTTTRPPRYG